jgi:chaperonin GroEL
MAHKQVMFRSEAREKVLRGASRLADAIRITSAQNQNQFSSSGSGDPLV